MHGACAHDDENFAKLANLQMLLACQWLDGYDSTQLAAPDQALPLEIQGPARYTVLPTEIKLLKIRCWTGLEPADDGPPVGPLREQLPLADCAGI